MLFDQLNSQGYYTVYPPLAQLFYYISTLAKENWWLNAVLLKVPLLMAECGSILLMFRTLKLLELNTRRVLLYALNPLIIVELVGNLHFEALTVFFSLLAVYLALINKEKLSPLVLALGVSAKLLPLLFFPFIWKYLRHSKSFFLLFGLASLLLFTPVLFGLHISKFAQSLDLYFGKFEFNGGIYNLLRFVGYKCTGYNLIRYIGPLMGLISMAWFAWLYNKQRQQDAVQLISCCFWGITIYYLLSTTVHPWYLSLSLALCIFLPYRFVVLWSFVIILSYINYSYDPYWENLLVISLEYIVVFGFMLYELRQLSNPIELTFKDSAE